MQARIELDRELEEKYPIINADLAGFTGTVVDDTDLRACFLSNARLILTTYQNAGLPVANLPYYIQGIERSGIYLDDVRSSIGKTASFIFQVGVTYARDTDPTGELGAALDTIKKHNKPEASGKIPLFQVTCDAERDFLWLLAKYCIFCFSTHRLTFTSRLTNNDNVAALLAKKGAGYATRVAQYEAAKAAPSPIALPTIGREEKRELSLDPRPPEPEFKGMYRPPSPRPARASAEEKISPIAAYLLVIDLYTSTSHWFNWFGRKRALALKENLIASQAVSHKVTRSKISNFIATGKTNVDKGFFSFFRSPTGQSTTLRALMQREQDKQNRANRR